jgi:hypothetical protein
MIIFTLSSKSLFSPIAPREKHAHLSGQERRMKSIGRKKTEGSRMKSKGQAKSNNREQSYVESDEEREKGHVDTRHKNFECENKTNLGCDPGIDVAG